MANKDYSLLSREELVGLLLKYDEKKKYGIVWDEERVPEKVVTDCQTHLPVLTEVKDKEIITNPDELTHLLIEGDNYHTLSVLNYTHAGKIDLIYIDPPYNTGNKDFIYNDKYVDTVDTYRHSKWLNFMNKRLELAHNLLADDGVIFISIDDNEVAQLKMLCDKTFGEQNFIANLPTIMNLKGNQDQFGFAGTHEYTLVYSKNKAITKINLFEIDEESLEEWQEDDLGLYKKGAPLRATGGEDKREDRAEMFYPILIKNDIASTISKEEHFQLYEKKTKIFNDTYLEELIVKYTSLGFEIVLPKSNENYGRWRWGFSDNNKIRLQTDVIINRTKNGISLYKKQRPDIGDLPSKKPKSLFYKPEYSSGNGTAQLKKMFNDKPFNNPKPVELIKDIIKIGTNKNAIVLDFFAGSGTTAQAILEINKEDNGSRQFILATNNENNNGHGKILDDVCYPRISKVFNGYTTNKGEQIEGLGNNLKYFKTSFVENVRNKDQVRNDVTRRCTEMLCVKEGIFNLFKESTDWKIYKKNGKYLAIYYDFTGLRLNKLRDEMNSIKGEKVLYCFTSFAKLDSRDFKDWDDIRLEAVPEPILLVYKKIFRKNVKSEL